jgi:phage regulator Rha-like protein
MERYFQKGPRGSQPAPEGLVSYGRERLEAPPSERNRETFGSVRAPWLRWFFVMQRSKDTPASQLPVPAQLIERRIYLVRGQKVMLAGDLAELYEVPTKAFNQAVRRNAHRFPGDFMFQLTAEEAAALRSQIVTLEKGRGRYSKYAPLAFTEHGVAMLSAVLNSDRAVQMSILIVRAFVKLREVAATNNDLAGKIEQIEAAQEQHANTQQQQGRILEQHASVLVSVVEDIRKLKNPPITRAIGFVPRIRRKK